MPIARLARILVASLLVVALHAPPARADVDLSGHLVGAIGAVLGFGPFPCTSIDVVQSGTSISITAQCNVFSPATFTAAGTINPVTGVLHATGQGTILCTTAGSLVIDGTATADSYAVFASVTCGFPASLAATRCGNGILDGGESQTCDDAAAAGLPTLAFPGCCTDHCGLQPNGTACVSGGGGQCDAPDHCDGASAACPDLKAPDSTPCDDFNLCTLSDACSGGVCVGGPHAPAGTDCLPGDGDPCVNGLCDSAGICQILFTTDPCDDGDACTTNDACNGFGYCEGGAPPACAPCFACDSSLGCIPAIAQGCKKPLAPKSKIAISDRVPDTGDKVTWKWSPGDATSTEEFGDPLTSDDYALCVFDQEGGADHLIMSAVAPHGTSWTPNARGFKYRDATLLPDGIQRITLKAGEAGKAKISVKGRGPNLGLPPILSAVTLPVTVQLQGPDGACWDALYTVAQTSNPVSFKATGGSPGGAFLAD
jgi:hypothetical protein